MTVRELIDELARYSPEMAVAIDKEDFIYPSVKSTSISSLTKNLGGDWKHTRDGLGTVKVVVIG